MSYEKPAVVVLGNSEEVIRGVQKPSTVIFDGCENATQTAYEADE